MKRIFNYLRSLLRVPVQVPGFEHPAPYFVCYIDKDYVAHPFAFFSRFEDADFFCRDFSDSNFAPVCLYLYDVTGRLKKVYVL